jgi:hypothetical protein
LVPIKPSGMAFDLDKLHNFPATPDHQRILREMIRYCGKAVCPAVLVESPLRPG